MTKNLKFEDITPPRGILTRVQVAARKRLLVHVDGEALDRDGLEGVDAALRELVDRERVRDATYGLVMRSETISDDDIRDLVSNVAKRPLTCVWAIVIRESENQFYACHSWLPVATSPVFEYECSELIGAGKHGQGERKRFSPWREFLLIKCSPVTWASVYNAEKRVANMHMTKR